MDDIAEMRAMQSQGASLRQIGLHFGLSHQAVFYRLGGIRKMRTGAPPAANDNKIVKMMPHNGGCSTTSGLVPVSLPRVGGMGPHPYAAGDVGFEVAA
ncbi:hypothetical protein KNLIENLN_00016 [Sinorhizobium phage NV1.1.1]|nr:hypothetical protein KNLIENLN_00016 [Sinorhizobium phage NV1.1.1]